nr:hypothetical protein [Tanacetum cinerariifolium]
FEGMLVVRDDVEADIREEQIPDDTAIVAAQEVVPTAVLEDVLIDSIPSHTPPTPPPQSSQDIPSASQAQSPPQQPQSLTPAQPQGVELIGEKEKTKEVKDIVDNAQVEGRQAEKQAEIYQIDLDHPSKFLSMQVTQNTPVSDASTIIPTTKQIIPAAEPNIPIVTITVAPVKVAAAFTSF